MKDFAISDDAAVQAQLDRLGALSVKELEVQTAHSWPLRRVDLPPGAAPLAPGALGHHYAPHTPVCLDLPQPGDAWVTWSEQAARWAPEPGVLHRVLSSSGDLAEAAHNLYAALIELDGAGVNRICMEAFPEDGLGAALNERIGRAAARKNSSSAA